MDQSWFDEVERLLFSSYALIDVIGMRDLLSKQGRVNENQVSELRAGIDLAARNPDHAFLTMADDVIVKTNWSASPSDYDKSYQPEAFLKLINEVREVIRMTLSLDSYAVVSQGSNALVDNSTLCVSGAQNHIFFGTLGSTFAELFEIDTAVRSALPQGGHEAQSLYLSEAFFLTLHFADYKVKNLLRDKLVPFNSKSIGGRCTYLPVDMAKLVALVSSPSLPPEG